MSRANSLRTMLTPFRRFSDRTVSDALSALASRETISNFRKSPATMVSKNGRRKHREKLYRRVACGEWSCVITRKACEDTDEPESYHNQSHPIESRKSRQLSCCHSRILPNDPLTIFLAFCVSSAPNACRMSPSITQIRNRFVQVSFIYCLSIFAPIICSLLKLTKHAWPSPLLFVLVPRSLYLTGDHCRNLFSIFAFNNHSFVRFLHPSSQK